ncbi:MAG: DUF1302 family protein [Acidobacteriota bacterium]
MEKKRWVLAGGLCVFLLLALVTQGEALFIDDKKTLEVSAKVQTRGTVRVQESDTEENGKGYSYPDVDSWDFVQHRNLALIEINHDLKALTKDLDILYPLRALQINAKYHLVGRFLYEAIYDYGGTLGDVADADPENFSEFQQSYDLWEAYADFTRGPLFVRIGRQNLAWGETDIFRLLDGINPLDNTFGGPFEDLDDRRIPLWMIRSSYNLGNLGPLSSLTLEGFVVPGPIDASVAPQAWLPNGNPYGAPVPRLLVGSLRNIAPDREWSESRWGARVQGLIGANLNVAVAHYKTFLDMPTPRSVVIGNPPLLADLNAMQLHWEYPEVQITGASMNYWESMTDIVFRGEVAMFWDEPAFIPQINSSTLFGPQLELPPEVLDLFAELLGVDIRDLGLNGIPIEPKSGRIPKKNILRYMLGLDKQIWIRPLNKVNTFFISGQYFGQYVPEFDERMAVPALVYPSLKKYVPVSQFEHVFTALINTMYMSGRLQPQVACAYDLKGAILVQPSINYLWEPFRFMVQYSTIMGSFANFGLFRDRDQVAVVLTYLLN